jgi:hypothetical protein
MQHASLILLFSFILGFIISYIYKHNMNYIYINDDIDITKYKFIDTKNKCYNYKIVEIKC